MIVLVVSSILFSIGISFAYILEREVLSQLYWSRSQVALNVANSALECVLYNDAQRNSFAQSIFGTARSFDCGSRYQVRNPGEWGTDPYVPRTVGTTDETRRLATFKFMVVETTNTDTAAVKNVPCAYAEMSRQCADGTSGISCNVEVSLTIRGYDRCSLGHKEGSDGQVVRRVRVVY